MFSQSENINKNWYIQFQKDGLMKTSQDRATTSFRRNYRMQRKPENDPKKISIEDL